MDFFEAVDKRYSHKELFLPDAVPIADLQRIARSGLAAPTGGNSQCVRLVILPDREALRPLCEASPHGGLASAPAAIALLTDSRVISGELNFEVEDYSAAATQMLLAATALGYVSLWLDSPYFDEDKQQAALCALGAPEGCHLWATLPIGLPAGVGSRRSKQPFAERAFYGKYGAL